MPGARKEERDEGETSDEQPLRPCRRGGGPAGGWGMYVSPGGRGHDDVSSDGLDPPHRSGTVPLPGPCNRRRRWRSRARASMSFDSGAPFNAGHYYVASPDGSRIYWEDTCCSASDVAVEASNDGVSGWTSRPDQAPSTGTQADGRPTARSSSYQRRDGGSNDFGNLFVEDMESGQRTRVTDLEKHAEGLWYLAPTFSADGRERDLPSSPETRRRARRGICGRYP